MAVLSALKSSGRLAMTVYTYEQAGDTLPVHVHDEATNHLTIVGRGSSFRCIGNPAIEGRILEAGDVVDWPVGEPHGFVALVDGARMIQILKAPPTPAV